MGLSALPLRRASQRKPAILGYFGSPNHDRASQQRSLLGVAVRQVPQFFGAHAYLLTRQGANVLLRNAFPIDHQADGLMLTLSEMVRGPNKTTQLPSFRIA
jgi:hypothetical protein